MLSFQERGERVSEWDAKNVPDYMKWIHQQPVNVSCTTQPNICVCIKDENKEDFQISISFRYISRTTRATEFIEKPEVKY